MHQALCTLQTQSTLPHAGGAVPAFLDSRRVTLMKRYAPSSLLRALCSALRALCSSTCTFISILIKSSMSLQEIIFPRVCITCMGSLSPGRNSLCNWCSENMFVAANENYNVSCEDIILPENIQFQHAVWKYDKGGYLQEILHALKYKNLPGLGVDIGKVLGKSLAHHPQLQDAESVRLVPVPLHPKKKRIRGYNQAREIADGVAKVTGFEVIREETVVRRRFTKTQTGFTLEQRKKNIQSAFRVDEPYSISQSHLIIIDDVFTTGATTFELANALELSAKYPMGIATVAMA